VESSGKQRKEEEAKKKLEELHSERRCKKSV
jgi:hypothetical protein